MENKIVAVTACPMGIAHTYMASEKLQQVAVKKGISLKVETNGSIGIQNKLTETDIKEASAVIVAADKKVEMERFIGKHVLIVPVTTAIYHPEALLDKALKQDAPIYKENMKIREIYKHLMNGISAMLPFIVINSIFLSLNIFLKESYIISFLNEISNFATLYILPILSAYIAFSIANNQGIAVGFITGSIASNYGSGIIGAIIAGFLSGYIVLIFKKMFRFLPNYLEGLKSLLILPIFSVIISSSIMIGFSYLMFPLNKLLTQYLVNINSIMGILLGVLLGVMMACDLGGPINKLAYLIALVTILNGSSSQFMAAVMVAGMVPPLGIALATTLSKKQFTAIERKKGNENYLMGAFFITEGAIPFVNKNKKVILPAVIIGSAIASSLSIFFNVSTKIPHGGLFILPFIFNWQYFILALFSGMIVTALIIIIFLK